MPEFIAINAKPFVAKLTLIRFLHRMDSGVSNHVSVLGYLIRTQPAVDHLVDPLGLGVQSFSDVVHATAAAPPLGNLRL